MELEEKERVVSFFEWTLMKLLDPKWKEPGVAATPTLRAKMISVGDLPSGWTVDEEQRKRGVSGVSYVSEYWDLALKAPGAAGKMEEVGSMEYWLLITLEVAEWKLWKSGKGADLQIGDSGLLIQGKDHSGKDHVTLNFRKGRTFV